MDADDDGGAVAFAGLTGAYWMDADRDGCPGCCSLLAPGGQGDVPETTYGRLAPPCGWGAGPSGMERARAAILTVAVATVISALLVIVFPLVRN